MTPTISRSEHDTVRAAARGERVALTHLFREHWSGVHRLASGLVGSSSVADDIAQDAFERAFRSLARFDGRSSFRTWIHRIVVNRSIDEMRRTKPTVSIDAAGDLAAPEHAPADAALRAAVGNLAPDRRTVVVMHYWLDYTLPEIAAILEIAEGTAHSRLARALKDLRSAMEVPA